VSSAAHKRRHKHEEHEEHANHERWLVAYADMLTVLMALFIVLFALSQIDQLKFAQFKDGLTKGTSSSNQAVSGSAGILEATNGDTPIDISPNSTGQPLQQSVSSEVRQKVLQSAQTAQTQSDLQEAKEEVEDYRAVEKQLDDALTAKGDQDQVTYRITADGLVVGLVADNVFFANASAEVEEKGREVLDTIAPILAQLPNDIAVQGHTNSLPLSATNRYRDNWDLSAARAMTVVQRFAAQGIAPAHLSGTGYADSRPLYPNEDPKALTGNRRVDLVVASPSSDAVKALLPEVAAGSATGSGPAELTGTTDTAGTTGTTGTGITQIDAAAGIAPNLATNVAH
jgi:chemotaxis protein MotB